MPASFPRKTQLYENLKKGSKQAGMWRLTGSAPALVRLSQESANDKHSSLFFSAISDEEKSFMGLTQACQRGGFLCLLTKLMIKAHLIKLFMAAIISVP